MGETAEEGVKRGRLLVEELAITSPPSAAEQLINNEGTLSVVYRRLYYICFSGSESNKHQHHREEKEKKNIKHLLRTEVTEIEFTQNYSLTGI